MPAAEHSIHKTKEDQQKAAKVSMPLELQHHIVHFSHDFYCFCKFCTSQGSVRQS